MSPGPAYEVRHSDSSLRSLQLVHPSMLPAVTAVLGELGTYVRTFPERTSLDRQTSVTTYHHPSPLVEIGYRLDEEKGVVNCVDVAAPLPPRVTAFVSYSHKDKQFLEEFKPYVFSLHQQGRIDFWHDGDLEAGTDWDESIQKALRSARAAVLIVTQNFLASEYILDRELPVLKDGYDAGAVRVYWIHVRHSLYEDLWIARLQALCDPSVPLLDLGKSKREKRLKEIGQALKALLVQ